MTPEAEAVRNAYRLRRQMHQPKWGGSNKRWLGCWQKAADLIAANEYDLEQYMEAQFELKAPFPMPNQLYNSAAVKRYETYNKDQSDPLDEVVRRLEVEMDFLETRMDAGFSLDEVLAFPGSPLTPLFCYCIAGTFKRPDLEAVFEDAAVRQLARTPLAAKVYESLSGGGNG